MILLTFDWPFKFTVGYCFVVGDDAIFCTLNVIANS